MEIAANTPQSAAPASSCAVMDRSTFVESTPTVPISPHDLLARECDVEIAATDPQTAAPASSCGVESVNSAGQAGPSECPPFASQSAWPATNEAPVSSLIEFEDPTIMFRSFGVRLLSHFALALVIGFATSLIFLGSPTFPFAGVKGSSPLQNVLANVGHAVTIWPLGFAAMLFRRDWCDMTYVVYWCIYALIIFGGARSVLEQWTGARESLRMFYFNIPLTYYFLFPPYVEAIGRFAQSEELPRFRPWKWRFEAVKRLVPWNEVGYMWLTFGAGLLYVAFIVLDDYFFLNATTGAFTRKWIRPLLSFLVRAIMQAAFRLAISISNQRTTKMWGVLSIQTFVAFPLARLVSSCQEWDQLGVLLAFDWVTFLYRCIRYWIRILPSPEIKPVSGTFNKVVQESVSGVTRLLDHAGCLGRFVRRLNRPMCSPETNSGHYWGFFFLMQNFCLTALYLSLLMGFAFHWLRGIQDNPGHRYLFPSGLKSLQFLTVALGLEVLQDTLAHTLVYFGNHQLAVPCTMNAVFPGWLMRASDLCDAVLASLTPMCAVSMLATYGYIVDAPL